jgi:MYXO-CTERM domain-containing protein
VPIRAKTLPGLIHLSGFTTKEPVMRTFLRTTVIGVAAWATSSLLPATASACGGFFCNTAQPVNQAAEGIIFADNGDGTVTAVIQIKYQGPSKNFSWLLPISSVPTKDSDIGVASDVAFQRLQSATNPSYALTVQVEGTCKQEQNLGVVAGSGGASSAAGGPTAEEPGGDGVTVEASGVVGAFDWTVISLDKSLADPSDVAVAWLKMNGYDVPSSAPKLLGPYLQDGMYLLALRLTKGADAGSIRPIVLTYKGTQPSIPIKVTAVAANDDMGVLTWVLGTTRAVPQNYLSLELNEARINWFNAASNYNSVVTDAANDAGGQGFVTELAGPTSALKQVIWTQSDDQTWNSFKSRVYQSFSEFFTTAYGTYGQFDGFWDATRAAVTLPSTLTFDDFKLCPNCYAGQIQFDPATYLADLDTSVIEPIKLVQNLVDAHPELSRMYTTMSADEMTLDPLFTFNPDLKDVSNVHTAVRTIECNPSVYQFEAPWRIDLPQGGVVRGTADDVNSGTWPAALGDLPPNRLIVRTSASGSGKVVEDDSGAIKNQLATYNATVPAGMSAGGGGSSGSPGKGVGAGNGTGDTSTAGTNNGDQPTDTATEPNSASGGCSVAGKGNPVTALAAAAALGAALIRRRRRV